MKILNETPSFMPLGLGKSVAIDFATDLDEVCR
jgi:hypothetical protein